MSAGIVNLALRLRYCASQSPAEIKQPLILAGMVNNGALILRFDILPY